MDKTRWVVLRDDPEYGLMIAECDDDGACVSTYGNEADAVRAAKRLAKEEAPGEFVIAELKVRVSCPVGEPTMVPA